MTPHSGAMPAIRARSVTGSPCGQEDLKAGQPAKATLGPFCLSSPGGRVVSAVGVNGGDACS